MSYSCSEFSKFKRDLGALITHFKENQLTDQFRIEWRSEIQDPDQMCCFMTCTVSSNMYIILM